MNHKRKDFYVARQFSWFVFTMDVFLLKPLILHLFVKTHEAYNIRVSVENSINYVIYDRKVNFDLVNIIL